MTQFKIKKPASDEQLAQAERIKLGLAIMRNLGAGGFPYAARGFQERFNARDVSTTLPHLRRVVMHMRRNQQQ